MLEEKWRLENRKRFASSSLQRQNLLLLCHERSGGHLIGHRNTYNARIWSVENPHEELELQRDSPKFSVFVPYLGGKCIGLSFSENQP
ncbi:hypothetical protein TNCV_2822821 [Trichonephila clavipes]|nr:hypothetical protein TNCV_2822821 [Trichonephila clavipes]